MKLLIVDDEQKIRELIAKYAVFEGYECIEAENGMQAVEMFRAKHLRPDRDGYYDARIGRFFRFARNSQGQPECADHPAFRAR